MAEMEQLTGHVVVAAGSIEQQLKKLGATGIGLHDAADELADTLSDECIKKIRFIASIRNKLAHGSELSAPVDIEYFDQVVNEVQTELNALLPPQEKVKIRDNQPEVINEINDEFKASMRRRLRLCGYLPTLNIVYFLALVVRGGSAGFKALILLLMFVTSIPLLIDGIFKYNKLQLYSGIFFFALYWVFTFFYALSRRDEKPQLRWFWYSLPLLSCRYILATIGHLMNFAEILLGVLPLVGLSGAGWLLIQKNYAPAYIITGAIWLYGVIVVISRRKKCF